MMVKLNIAFSKFGIIAKLNLILFLLFFLVLIFSYSALSWILQSKAEQEIKSKADLALELMIAARNYTTNEIQPQLVNPLFGDDEFVKQTVPAYSASSIFNELRKEPVYEKYSYREAANNPTNLKDKATDFDSALIKVFQEKRNLKQINGFRSINNERMYYIARPIEVKKVSCLQCHSLPKSAPQSLINTYGDQNGFGWQFGDIVAAQILTIPANQVFSSVNKTLNKIFLIIFFLSSFVIVVINIYIKNGIEKPLLKLISNLRGAYKDRLGFLNHHIYGWEINELIKLCQRL